MRKNKTVFITATDTRAGKTIATFALALLWRRRGASAGVMKPVQCAGADAQFLRRSLKLDDGLELVNPCFAPEPLSPHLAFRRAGKRIDLAKIRKNLKILQAKYDVVLIEGAGGLMVPLRPRYYNADLIRDLKAEVIIVSRLGLGTINHTILTVNQAQAAGLKVRGVLFSDMRPGRKTLPEKTNPAEIARLTGVKVLGIIPYLKKKTAAEVLRKCRAIAID